MKIQVLTLLEYSDKKYDHLPKIRVIGIRSLAKENELKATLRIGKKKGDFGFETENAHLIIDNKNCLVVCLDLQTKIELLEYLLT